MDFASQTLAPYLIASLASWIVALKVMVVSCAVFFVAERVWPAERHQPLKNLAFNLRWMVVGEFMVALLGPAVAITTVLGVRAVGVKGLIGIDFTNGSLLYFTSPILYLFIFDAFYYWFHRAQHAVPFLWEQHKFHHADESLNSTARARHHWTESLFRVPFIYIPLAVLFDISPAKTGFLAFFAAYWAYFKHANLRLPLGRLSWLLVGPQVHRIHHSRLPEHQDKNLAAYFPVYDIAFKTYFRPHAAEFPPTGLSSGERITSIRQAFVLPFTGWIRLARSRARRDRTAPR